MNEHRFGSGDRGLVFGEADGRVYLKDVYGLTAGYCSRDEGPSAARGLLSVRTDEGVFQGGDLTPVEHRFDEAQARLVWTAGPSLRIESLWAFDAETGVCHRQDAVVNVGQKPVTIQRCLARFPFTPGRYEVYGQDSRWCNENQGHWRELNHGSVRFWCEQGRTTQGSSPFAVLRRIGDRAVGFHVLPIGNWTIEVAARTHWNDSIPFAVVELGLSDQNLALELAAGERIELPEIILQPIGAGPIHQAAPVLHRYLLGRCCPGAKPEAPVVYNTWFYKFDNLNAEDLRGQLAAAAEIGCEVFTIDAGWYGAEDTSWHSQTGDWRENRAKAFRGRMKEFADEVRRAGLGFGIWMEPERFCASVPVRTEHPEWFLPGEGDHYRLDLRKPEARQYIRSEIVRLVKTYQLAWMKVDFNFHMGRDRTGAEFWTYYRHWYGVLDQVRAECPETFFENCASGAMRLDIETLRHFDSHFLSDTVNPVDVLRINEGAMLRLPPGRIGKWAALRSIGKSVPTYGVPPEQDVDKVVVPSGATWDRSETADLDFVARVCLSGMVGFTGDLAGLTETHRKRLAHHVAIFKRWRRFIAGSVAHLLTPPELKENRSGWSALRLAHPDNPASLLFVYRLHDLSESRTFRLEGLDESINYRVVDDEGALVAQRTGGQLAREGLEVTLPRTYTAGFFAIEPE